ncbi:hypothetical protein [Desulfobulbus propionicus]
MQQQATMNGMNAAAGQGRAQTMAQHQDNPISQGVVSGPVMHPAPGTHIMAVPPVHSSPVFAAGLFGLVVVGTGTMGACLHKVHAGDMSMGDAVNHSLARGAVGGIATAAATAASSALSRGGLLGLAVTLATATGVSYLLSKP